MRIAFPLAPGLTPELAPASGAGGGVRARIPLSGGAWLEFAEADSREESGIRWSVERAPYFPEFGKRVERFVLVGRADAFTAGHWLFQLSA